LKAIDWYFDFVSGYAYLQFEQLDRLPGSVSINFKPILFAGLLNHFGHLGPAELPPKRLQTYRHWVWLGEQLGISLQMPPAHPFNSLAALRIAIACGEGREVIATIFRFIWQEGRDAGDADEIAELAARLGIADASATLADTSFKTKLRANTREAVARGVFGVPTSVVDEQSFWGLDATEMLIAYLHGTHRFDSDAYLRIHNLPVGASRK